MSFAEVEHSATRETLPPTPEEHQYQQIEHLQARWFEYRVNQMSAPEIEARIERILAKEESEVRREFILNGSAEVKRDVVMSDLVLPEGNEFGSERVWFRAAFPDKTDGSITIPFLEVLEQFSRNPDDPEVLMELDRLYHDSLTKH